MRGEQVNSVQRRYPGKQIADAWVLVGVSALLAPIGMQSGSHSC